nr:hypothetical protein [Tanacetum cinerariifolium]
MGRLWKNSFLCCVEYDHVGMVRAEDAAIKANNRFDVFHIPAKQGHLEVLKILMKAQSELSMATKSLVIHAHKWHKSTKEQTLPNEILTIIVDDILEKPANSEGASTSKDNTPGSNFTY